MKTALLLIDIQNDYFPGGKMEVKGSAEAALAAKRLLNDFREKRLPVIHIQHVSIRPGATFLLPDTPGVEIHESVTPLPGEAVFRKNYPSGFRNTPLLDYLQKNGLDKLIIGGMMTHMCVDSTVRSAFDNGFQNALVSDACATRDLSYGDVIIPAAQVQAAFLAALGAVFARITTADDFLAKAVGLI